MQKHLPTPYTYIVGGAGTGKTTLACELARSLTQDDGIPTLALSGGMFLRRAVAQGHPEDLNDAGIRAFLQRPDLFTLPLDAPDTTNLHEAAIASRAFALATYPVTPTMIVELLNHTLLNPPQGIAHIVFDGRPRGNHAQLPKPVLGVELLVSEQARNERILARGRQRDTAETPEQATDRCNADAARSARLTDLFRGLSLLSVDTSEMTAQDVLARVKPKLLGVLRTGPVR